MERLDQYAVLQSGAIQLHLSEVGEDRTPGETFIRVDDTGQIVEFRVMVRPLQALNSVHELMGAHLAAGNSKQEVAS